MSFKVTYRQREMSLDEQKAKGFGMLTQNMQNNITAKVTLRLRSNLYS